MGNLCKRASFFCMKITSWDRYVAEMMMNRVLRFYEKPAGVFQGSVFLQLNGGVGPSAITCDKNGVLYLAQYDLRGTPSLLSHRLTVFDRERF